MTRPNPSGPPPGLAVGHFRELDGMRGVLAVAVMLFHFGLNTIIARLSHGLITDGQWGLCVDFFFLLSGFVLVHSFLRRPLTLREYATKRVLRLAPMFLIATFAALIAGGLAMDARTLVANLLMVQPFFGIASIDMVSWSIPFELFLPVAGVFLYARAARLSPKVLNLLVIGAFALAAAMAFLLVAGDDHPLWRAVAGLGSGTLLYLVFRRALRPRSDAWPSLVFFAGAVLAMLLAGRAQFLGCLFPPLAAAAIWFGAGATGIFSLPPLQALGRWSYSIYLLHIPVLLTANALLGDGRVQGSAAVKLCLIAATLALAGFGYRFVEMPLMNLGRRAAQSESVKPA